jgi:hypothetical protein
MLADPEASHEPSGWFGHIFQINAILLWIFLLSSTGCFKQISL